MFFIRKIKLLIALIFVLSVAQIVQAESEQGIDFSRNEKRVVRSKTDSRASFIPNELIIHFKKDALDVGSEGDLYKARLEFEKLGGDLIGKSEGTNLGLFRIKEKHSGKKELEEAESLLEKKKVQLEKLSSVERVEFNYQRQLLSIPTNDPRRDELWGFDNYGQTVAGREGQNDADIDLPEAWSVSKGSRDVIVAVIDSGIAHRHADLINGQWNGNDCLDKDGNYLGGCIHGYDFEDGDKDPVMKDRTHGTRVASVIGSTANNGIGVLGVAPRAKIMSLKTALTTFEIAEATDFAIANGAKIVNASYGGPDFSYAEYHSIQRLRQAGGLLIAGAGNSGTNNDNSHFYPSDYDLDNIISVAATNGDDELAGFSSYGKQSVDVAAPGVNILTSSTGKAVFEEDFNSVTAPNLPSGWTKTGTMGTYNHGAGNNGLIGDVNREPYGDNSDQYAATFSLEQLNDSGTTAAVIEFTTACDTEYSDGWTDYMALEGSVDGGTSFQELERWDEKSIDNDTSAIGAASREFEVVLPDNYLTTNDARFRFRWVTNGTDNNHFGCAVDDLAITTYQNNSAGSIYEFSSGTSFSTPHVSGLAALLWSYKPELTYQRLREIILESGDSLDWLDGKVATGKRINAHKAITSPSFYASQIYRFYSNQHRSHFYTMSAAEKDYIIKTYPKDEWNYEGVAWKGLKDNSASPKPAPVHRFFSITNNKHFFTISESEKDYILGGAYPEARWKYEGIAWYAYSGNNVAGLSPIYRFYSQIYQAHFYTISGAEKNFIIKNYPKAEWNYEGIAYYSFD